MNKEGVVEKKGWFYTRYNGTEESEKRHDEKHVNRTMRRAYEKTYDELEARIREYEDKKYKLQTPTVNWDNVERLLNVERDIKKHRKALVEITTQYREAFGNEFIVRD